MTKLSKFNSALLISIILLVLLPINEARMIGPQVEPRRSPSGDVIYSPSETQSIKKTQENNSQESKPSLWDRVLGAAADIFKSKNPEDARINSIPVSQEDQNVNSDRPTIKMIPIQDQRPIF